MDKLLPYIAVASLLSGCADRPSETFAPLPEDTQSMELRMQIGDEYNRIFASWNIPGLHLELPSWETVTIDNKFKYSQDSEKFLRMTDYLRITDKEGVAYTDYNGDNVIDFVQKGEGIMNWNGEDAQKVLETLKKIPKNTSDE